MDNFLIMRQNCKNALLCLLALMFFLDIQNIHAQCECTDCPIYIPSSTTQFSNLNISGASNPTLGLSDQGLCQVCLHFTTDAIQENTVVLDAPNNSSVTLIQATGVNINNDITFDICFIPCDQTPNPDAGHSSNFMTNDGWNVGVTYTGTYHPPTGCLEDLTGDVDGDWELAFTDTFFGDDANLLDWYLVFNDDSGLNCANASECSVIICEADAGTIDVVNSPSCPGSPINFSTSNNNNNAPLEHMFLVVDASGIIVGITAGTNGSFTSDDCTSFTVYSYNYDPNEAYVPSLGENISNIDCGSDCCDLYETIITFEDNIGPMWTYTPLNQLEFDCIDELLPLENIEYDDNCAGIGTLEGMEIIDGNACDGGLVTRTWMYTDFCENEYTYMQLIDWNPTPISNYIDPPEDITVACDEIPLNPESLAYENNANNNCQNLSGTTAGMKIENYDPCGGEVLFIWQDMDACGREINHTQTLTILASDLPIFQNPPPDISVNCAEIPDSPPNLIISNNSLSTCLIEDVVTPIITNNYNGCEGTITYMWNYIDPCDREITYEQTITIYPVAEPSFIDIPENITIDCSAINDVDSILFYSNDTIPECSIEGFVTAEKTLIGDPCSGQLSLYWIFEDACERTIEHTQFIEISSESNISFLDHPADSTLDCGIESFSPIDLNFTNGLSGNCLFSGTTSPEISTSNDTIFVLWEEAQPCSQDTLSHTQIVLMQALPDLSLNADSIFICAGESIDLSEILVQDLNGNAFDLSYHNSSPADFSNELTSGIQTPSSNQNYYLLGINEFGCSQELVISIIVDPLNNAADDGIGEVACNDNASYNLFDFLINVNSTSGNWNDVSSSNIDLSDPFQVSFENLSPGEYTFEFVSETMNACPSDTALATIEIIEGFDVQVITVICAADDGSYSVTIQIPDGHSLSANFGNVIALNNGLFEIQNIPIAEVLEATGTSPNTICNESILVQPPDCDCPTVNPPINPTNLVLCTHELPAILSVSVTDNQKVNWYSEAIGGTAFLSNSLSFQSPETNPGTYIYYTETEDQNNADCVSFSRTAVSLTILEDPVSFNDTLYACLNCPENTATFNLNDAIMQLNFADEISFHLDYLSAQNDIGPLDNEYVNFSPMETILFARIENSNGCYSIAELFLDVWLPPQVAIMVENELCFGENGSMDIFILSDHEDILTSIDDATYANTLEYEDLPPGNYTLTTIDSNNCTSIFPFEVNEGDSLIIDNLQIDCFDNGTNEDASDDFYMIVFSVQNNGVGDDYNLSLDGVFINSFLFNDEIAYMIPADGNTHEFILTNNFNGCSQNFVTNILDPCSVPCTIFPDASIITSPNDTISCFSETINIAAVNEANVQYTWIVNNEEFSLPNFTVSSESEIILIALDTLTDCTATDTLLILDLTEFPSITIDDPGTISCIDENTDISALQSSIGNEYQYTWYKENIGNIHDQDTLQTTVSSGGWYYLEILNQENGCSSIDSIFVSENVVYPMFVLEDSVMTDCGIENATLVINNLDISNAETNWSTNEGFILTEANQEQIDVQGSGTYFVSVTNPENGCVRMDSTYVTIAQFPIIDNYLIDNETCIDLANGSILIEPAVNQGALTFYLDGVITPYESFTNLTPGSYELTTVNTDGCSIDTVINIEPGNQIEIFLDTQLEYSTTNNQLTASASINMEDIESITWTPDENLSCSDCLITEILSPGIAQYIIEITDSLGCTSLAIIDIIYTQSEEIFIPNVFSPNSDDDNGYFTIFPGEDVMLSDLSMQIYDRWGELVYEANQLQNANQDKFWDGTFNGEPLVSGVYVYAISALLADTNKPLYFYGDITLIR